MILNMVNVNIKLYYKIHFYMYMSHILLYILYIYWYISNSIASLENISCSFFLKEHLNNKR